jgi:SAM-dependent methyltransferase
MGFYERYCWAPLVEYAMRQPPIMELRRNVVPLARGRVLEVGVGSGLNLPLYEAGQTRFICGFDPSHPLLERARERAAAPRVAVDLLAGSAEEIGFADATFDTVVTTFTLCSIPNVARALAEMRRVLKPSGELLFAEHGLSRDAAVSVWQRRLNPFWRVISGGCNLNRPIAALLETAGFRIARLETDYLPGPKVLTYCSSGSARPSKQ